MEIQSRRQRLIKGRLFKKVDGRRTIFGPVERQVPENLKKEIFKRSSKPPMHGQNVLMREDRKKMYRRFLERYIDRSNIRPDGTIEVVIGKETVVQQNAKGNDVKVSKNKTKFVPAFKVVDDNGKTVIGKLPHNRVEGARYRWRMGQNPAKS